MSSFGHQQSPSLDAVLLFLRAQGFQEAHSAVMSAFDHLRAGDGADSGAESLDSDGHSRARVMMTESQLTADFQLRKSSTREPLLSDEAHAGGRVRSSGPALPLLQLAPADQSIEPIEPKRWSGPSSRVTLTQGPQELCFILANDDDDDDDVAVHPNDDDDDDGDLDDKLHNHDRRAFVPSAFPSNMLSGDVHANNDLLVHEVSVNHASVSDDSDGSQHRAPQLYPRSPQPPKSPQASRIGLPDLPMSEFLLQAAKDQKYNSSNKNNNNTDVTTKDITHRLSGNSDDSPAGPRVPAPEHTESRPHAQVFTSIDKYRDVFFALDSDHNSKLDLQEVTSAIQKFGHHDSDDSHVHTLFFIADRDRDGMLSFHEFVMLAISLDLNLSSAKTDPAVRRKSITASISLSKSTSKLPPSGNDQHEDVFAKLKAMFHFIDSDNNGEISADELQVVFHLLGIQKTIRQCKWMIRSVNLISSLTTDELDDIRERFSALDLDGNGHVGAAELRTHLNARHIGVSPLVAEQMVADFDENDDNEIDFEEFVHLTRCLQASTSELTSDSLDFDRFLALLKSSFDGIGTLVQVIAPQLPLLVIQNKSFPESSSNAQLTRIPEEPNTQPIHKILEATRQGSIRTSNRRRGPPPEISSKKKSNNVLRNRLVTLIEATHKKNEVDNRKRVMHLRKRFSDHVSDDLLVSFQHAAAYLEDAFNGRLKSGKGSTFLQSWNMRTAFALHAHAYFKNLLLSAAFVLCLLIFAEPPSHRHTDWDRERTFVCKIIEICLLCILLLDYVLRSVYMEQSRIFKKTATKILYLSELISVVDVVVSLVRGGVTFRVARFFRPWIYILLDKNSTILLNLNVQAATRLRYLIVILLLWMINFSLIANQVSSHKVWEEDPSPPSYKFEPFGTFWNSFLSFWTLLSYETYDDFITPYVRRYPELLIVYIGFGLVAVYTILSITVAVQATEFKNLQTSIAKSELKKRRKTLEFVFRMVCEIARHHKAAVEELQQPQDTEGRARAVSHATSYRPEDERVMTFEDVRMLLICYQPTLDERQVVQCFSETDVDGSGTIDMEEFLNLCEVLSDKSVIRGSTEVNTGIAEDSHHLRRDQATAKPQAKKSKSKALLKQFSISARHASRKTWALRLTFQNRIVRVAMCLLICFDTVVVLSVTEKSSNDYARAASVVDEVVLGVTGLVGIALPLALQGRHAFWDNGWNRYRTYAIVCSIVLIGLRSYISAYFDRLGFSNHAWFNAQGLACALRFPQVIEASDSLMVHTELIFSTAPLVKDFSVFVAAVMYIYCVCGLELFRHSPYYDSVQAAWLTLCQLLTLANWNNVMFLVMDNTNSVGLKVVAAVYHTSFTFATNVLIISQLVAVMYEIFNTRKYMIESYSNTKSKKSTTGTQAAFSFDDPDGSHNINYSRLQSNQSSSNNTTTVNTALMNSTNSTVGLKRGSMESVGSATASSNKQMPTDRMKRSMHWRHVLVQRKGSVSGEAAVVL
eukprot:c6068_g1_i1.p1 GENE.c6068_g1_i1~~c6068_g1_i1.p1  ORF type:complete len:1489 (+),score=397.09 c6068_g1_i1:82-4548(+)